MARIGYSHTAASYTELHRYEQEEKIRALLPFFQTKSPLLDLGCGTGLASIPFKGIKVGVDSSKEMLLHCVNKRLMRVAARAEELPFRDNSFNSAICLTAIHNFKNPQRAVKELKRVCRGVMAISLLKRAIRFSTLLLLLETDFQILREIDTDKDLILITKPI